MTINIIVWEINQFIGKAAAFSFGDDLARTGINSLLSSLVVKGWVLEVSDFRVRGSVLKL